MLTSQLLTPKKERQALLNVLKMFNRSASQDAAWMLRWFACTFLISLANTYASIEGLWMHSGDTEQNRPQQDGGKYFIRCDRHSQQLIWSLQANSPKNHKAFQGERDHSIAELEGLFKTWLTAKGTNTSRFQFTYQTKISLKTEH